MRRADDNGQLEQGIRRVAQGLRFVDVDRDGTGTAGLQRRDQRAE